MKKVTINLYEFNELNLIAQRKAIEEHRNFMLNIMDFTDFISGGTEYDTPEELKKAYDSEWDYINESDEAVIENIEINDCLFYADGDMVNYCFSKDGINLKIDEEKYKIF